MSEMDAYKDLFLSESTDYLQSITDGLLALEETPHDLAHVEVVFRGAHSLKGMSAAMGYERTADLTHTMEELMDRVRRRDRKVDAELVDLMLDAVDAVRRSIAEESSGQTDATDFSELVARIVEMQTADSRDPKSGPLADEHVDDSRGSDPSTVRLASEAGGHSATPRTEGDGARSYSVVVTLEEDCVLKAVRAYMVIKRLNYLGTVTDTIPSARDIEDERFDLEFTVKVQTASAASELTRAVTAVTEVADARVVEEAIVPQSETKASSDQHGSSGSSRRRDTPMILETQTVRISIGYLDSMVDLVGELITFRSRLDRIAEAMGNRALDDAVEDLHRISTELRYVVMDTRMVPVENIFNRFPRMVRDLARELDKEVVFRMDGLGIELDRTVLDEIGDPIVHLLRNSIDHGIEKADARKAAGKPPKGTVTLSAKRERDTVRITISDDGAGIDTERIWTKACSVGLVNPDDRATFDDEDVLMLTCAPGFSTVENATRVSGRGVGMDAVKGKIEYLGGSLAISSKRGVGTDFELTLPLTLAIIQVLLVSAGRQTFALPLSFVDEVLAAETVSIDTIDGMPVMVYRDDAVIPLHRLDRVLGLSDNDGPAADSKEQIILIHSPDGGKRGLIVESLGGRTEAVIKPLSPMFRDTKGLSGAT
ncbi:MAG: chemotaxis protein CheA, partial [Actinobacteria bacterium]|nr:chemotaxis protein CheA [Actinomycetota bacterium]